FHCVAIGVLLAGEVGVTRHAMYGMARGSNSRLVERNRNDLVASEVADISDLNRQISSRLPLNIEGVVNGVGQLIGAIIGCEREQLLTTNDSGGVRQEICNIRRVPSRRWL